MLTEGRGDSSSARLPSRDKGPTGPGTKETDVFSPRTLIIAGVVLIAVALGPSGHGLWWLVGFLWFLPHAGRRGHRCGGASRHRQDPGLQDVPGPVAQPDPTRDRHEAFPAR